MERINELIHSTLARPDGQEWQYRTASMEYGPPVTTRTSSCSIYAVKLHGYSLILYVLTLSCHTYTTPYNKMDCAEIELLRKHTKIISKLHWRRVKQIKEQNIKDVYDVVTSRHINIKQNLPKQPSTSRCSQFSQGLTFIISAHVLVFMS